MKLNSMLLRILMTAIVMAAQCFCHSEANGKKFADAGSQVKATGSDSIMMQNLGKKVSGIILNSDSTKVTAISYVEDKADMTLALDSLLGNIVRNSLCQPSMYETNKKIYTTFEPWTIIDFYKGDDHVAVLLDYSMNKWKVKEDNGNEISTFDMPNGTLLLMMHLIFPENEDIAQRLTKYLKEK